MPPKNLQEKNLQLIRELQRLPENKRCADCGDKLPQYVNLTHHTFICSTCSGIHREFLHRIKGISASEFTFEEAEDLKNGGNELDRQTYLVRFTSESARPLPGDQQQIRSFIRSKYVEKCWVPVVTRNQPVSSQSESQPKSSTLNQIAQNKTTKQRIVLPQTKSMGIIRQPSVNNTSIVEPQQQLNHTPTQTNTSQTSAVPINTTNQPITEDWGFFSSPAQPQTQPQSFSQPQPQPNAFSQPQPQPNPFSQPQSQPQSFPQSQPQTQSFPQPQSQPNPFPQPQSQPNPFSQPQSQPQSFPQSQTQTQSFPQSQSQPQSFPQSQSQPNPFSQSQTQSSVQPPSTVPISGFANFDGFPNNSENHNNHTFASFPNQTSNFPTNFNQFPSHPTGGYIDQTRNFVPQNQFPNSYQPYQPAFVSQPVNFPHQPISTPQFPIQPFPVNNPQGFVQTSSSSVERINNPNDFQPFTSTQNAQNFDQNAKGPTQQPSVQIIGMSAIDELMHQEQYEKISSLQKQQQQQQQRGNTKQETKTQGSMNDNHYPVTNEIHNGLFSLHEQVIFQSSDGQLIPSIIMAVHYNNAGPYFTIKCLQTGQELKTNTQRLLKLNQQQQQQQQQTKISDPFSMFTTSAFKSMHPKKEQQITNDTPPPSFTTTSNPLQLQNPTVAHFNANPFEDDRSKNTPKIEIAPGNPFDEMF